MIRTCTFLVTISLALTTCFTTPATAKKPCYEPRPWPRMEVKRMARCLEGEIRGVPGGWNAARQVGSCESGWYHKADGAGYEGTWQTTAREHQHWPIPGAPRWARRLLDKHPNWRNSHSRLHPYRQTIVTLSHVAGPTGWDYVGVCYP